MIEFQIQLDPHILSALDEAAASVEAEAEAAVATLADRLVQLLSDAAPKGKTGELAASFSTTTDGLLATFESDSDHWAYVVGGTAPHPIYGYGGPLAFEWEKVGGMAFFWAVQHPGTAPNDFRETALEELLPEAEAEVASLFDRWSASFA